MKSIIEMLGRPTMSILMKIPRLQRNILLILSVLGSGVLLVYSFQQNEQESKKPLYKMAPPQWTWVCLKGRCVRMPASEHTILQCLSTCNMLCASTQLWPQPTGPIRLATDAVPIQADKLTLKIVTSPNQDVSQHLTDAFILLKTDIQMLECRKKSNSPEHGHYMLTVIVQVMVDGTGDSRMRLNTDESYKLSLLPSENKVIVNISAHSFCGARHGFETLSQLIWLDAYVDSLLIIKAATIEDSPKFKYRGLLLDTARNFISVNDIIRTLDAMAASKLNTFHWHATDAQSFPLKLSSAPLLAEYGSYSRKSVYTVQDIKAIVRRARLRGIRVLIELDVPARVGRAWSWGPESGLGQLTQCVEAEPWNDFCNEPPCGQLNPKNPHIYELLKHIYSEIIQLTGTDDIFHIGGSNISYNCWRQHWKDIDPKDLWLEFTQNALQSLEHANGGKIPEMTILWSSPLTQSLSRENLHRVDQSLSIQSWGYSNGAESLTTLNAGVRTIISHTDAWFLDCYAGSWVDKTSRNCRFNSWQQMYEHRPWAKNKLWVIEGGEVCQWTDQVGAGSLDASIWPRAAAVAERLWSDMTADPTGDVSLRLDTQRSRLTAHGVRAQPLWPRWCSHNPHVCA